MVPVTEFGDRSPDRMLVFEQTTLQIIKLWATKPAVHTAIVFVFVGLLQTNQWMNNQVQKWGLFVPPIFANACPPQSPMAGYLTVVDYQAPATTSNKLWVLGAASCVLNRGFADSGCLFGWSLQFFSGVIYRLWLEHRKHCCACTQIPDWLRTSIRVDLNLSHPSPNNYHPHILRPLDTILFSLSHTLIFFKLQFTQGFSGSRFPRSDLGFSSHRPSLFVLIIPWLWGSSVASS